MSDFQNLPDGQVGIQFTYNTDSGDLRMVGSVITDRLATFGLIEKAKQCKAGRMHRHLQTVTSTQIGLLVFAENFGTPEELVTLTVATQVKVSESYLIGILHGALAGMMSQHAPQAKPTVQRHGGLILPTGMKLS